MSAARTVRGNERKPAAHTVPGLDIVRFLAAAAVLLFHFAFFSWNEPISPLGGRAALGQAISFPGLTAWTSWGWVGVHAFFVISGFVIPLSAEGRSGVEFLQGRMLRLLPGLWFFATLALIVTFLYAAIDKSEIIALYAKSMILFPRGPWIDGVYWSLVIECVFYSIIFAVVALGLFDRLEVICSTAAVAITAFYIVVWISLLSDGLLFSNTVLEIARSYVAKAMLLSTGAYFILGFLLFISYRRGLRRTRLVLIGLMLFAGATALWLDAVASPAALAHHQPALVPVCVWLLMVGLIVASLLVNEVVQQADERLRRAVRILGLATYPVYLIHNISGAYLFGRLVNFGMGPAAALVAAAGICLSASVGFVLWIEPSLRRLLGSALGVLAAWLALLIVQKRDRSA